MEGSFTFNVLVLSGKSKWTSISRWESAIDARVEAQKLVSAKKHAGVKVVQEHFDEVKNRFMERTIFKMLKRDDSTYEDDFDDDDNADVYAYPHFDDYDGIDNRGRGILLLGGILSAAALVLAIGWFAAKDSIPATKLASESQYFVYDLPVVMTNIAHRGKTYSLRINLQLELDDREDSQAVEMALARIMESVIDELQVTDAGDLNRTDRLENLRGILRNKIQNAVGETNVNGVLFKDIRVF